MARAFFLLAPLVLATLPALGASPPQWRNASAEGGNIAAIAVSGADARQALVVTSGALLFETRDRGATWRQTGISPCGWNPLTYRPDAFYTACNGGIWRTRDGGASWEKFSQKTQLEARGHSAVDFSSRPGEAIAWGSFGASVTNDDGKSWIDVAGPFDVYTGTVVPQSRRAIALHKQDGSWRLVESADFGGSWAPSSPPLECAYRTFCPSAIAADMAGTLYLTDGGGVYVRRDGSAALRYWTREELGLSGGALKVSVVPGGRALAYTDSSAALSIDGGLGWTRLEIPPAWVTDAALASDGSVWFATSKGVWRRDADGTWSSSSIGLRGQDAIQVQWAGADTPTLLAYGYETGWMRSEDEGSTWKATTLPGPGTLFQLQRANELWLLAAGGTAQEPATGLHRSRDAGKTWEVVNAAVRTDKGNIDAVMPAGADARVWYGSMTRYASPGFEVYALAVSRDGGRSWADLSSLPVSPSSVFVTTLADASLAYARSSAGWYRTRDEGRTWSLVWPQARGAVSIVADAVDAATVYAYSDSALWASRDGGDTWSPATLPDTHGAFTATADPWDAGRVYAQSSDGSMLQSRDRGGSWRRMVVPARWAYSPGRLASIRREGDARVFASAGGGIRVAHAEASSLALGSDLWWNPAEPGMGLTITQHESGRLFVVWYAYDEQRRATWYVVPEGDWNGNAFTGAMYRTTGTPLGRAFDASRSSVERVGSMTLAFDSTDSARMAYTFDGGAPGEKRIQRQLFGPPSRPPSGLTDRDRADLWWDSRQPGSGVAISHQYDKVFVTWYTYDAAGRPQWLILPDSARIPAFVDGIYDGALYTADGPPLTAPFDPAAVNVRQVGTARLHFVGEDEAWLEYTLSGLLGQTVQLRLTRQPF